VHGGGRCRQRTGEVAVGGLGLPTLVLQEGGYFVPKLGENARTWLRGLLGAPLDLRATPS